MLTIGLGVVVHMQELRTFVHPAEADAIADALEQSGATDIRVRSVAPAE